MNIMLMLLLSVIANCKVTIIEADRRAYGNELLIETNLSYSPGCQRCNHEQVQCRYPEPGQR